jgi:ABC-type lipoprotein export system ATPase subunit
MNAAIDFRNVYRIYEAPEGATVALQGLSLSTAPGEVVVVLGPSGAGKSTLLRIAAGLDRPSAGVANVLGVDVARLSPRGVAGFRARELGILDQHYARSLSPDLTCRETIAQRLELEGVQRRVRERRVDELLDRVGLGGRGDDLPASLSGGEQQRVAVCTALAHRPGLLLADEPGGELDAASASTVYGLIAELARDQGTTALVVSHDPGAASIADRLLTIRDGRLSEEARPGATSTIVVGRGGWLRIPEPLLAGAGIGERAIVGSDGARLVLEASGPAPRRSSSAVESVTEPPAGAAPVAELRGVFRAFGHGDATRVVLDRLDAAFAPGRLTLVLGRSGSGKTTLLNLLAGLDRPDEGEVLLLGRPISDLGRKDLALLRREHIGVIGQEPGLVAFLSAAENVSFALQIRGQGSNARPQALSALAEMRLEDRADQRVDRLSVGERQRVAVARALVHDPRLLLADEPTARLDEQNARMTADLLLRAARSRGAAVVCATHDPALLELADDVLRLESA